MDRSNNDDASRQTRRKMESGTSFSSSSSSSSSSSLSSVGMISNIVLSLNHFNDVMPADTYITSFFETELNELFRTYWNRLGLMINYSIYISNITTTITHQRLLIMINSTDDNNDSNSTLNRMMTEEDTEEDDRDMIRKNNVVDMSMLSPENRRNLRLRGNENGHMIANEYVDIRSGSQQYDVVSGAKRSRMRGLTISARTKQHHHNQQQHQQQQEQQQEIVEHQKRQQQQQQQQQQQHTNAIGSVSGINGRDRMMSSLDYVANATSSSLLYPLEATIEVRASISSTSISNVNFVDNVRSNITLMNEYITLFNEEIRRVIADYSSNVIYRLQNDTLLNDYKISFNQNNNGIVDDNINSTNINASNPFDSLEQIDFIDWLVNRTNNDTILSPTTSLTNYPTISPSIIATILPSQKTSIVNGTDGTIVNDATTSPPIGNVDNGLGTVGTISLSVAASFVIIVAGMFFVSRRYKNQATKGRRKTLVTRNFESVRNLYVDDIDNKDTSNDISSRRYENPSTDIQWNGGHVNNKNNKDNIVSKQNDGADEDDHFDSNIANISQENHDCYGYETHTTRLDGMISKSFSPVSPTKSMTSRSTSIGYLMKRSMIGGIKNVSNTMNRARSLDMNYNFGVPNESSVSSLDNTSNHSSTSHTDYPELDKRKLFKKKGSLEDMKWYNQSYLNFVNNKNVIDDDESNNSLSNRKRQEQLNVVASPSKQNRQVLGISALMNKKSSITATTLLHPFGLNSSHTNRTSPSFVNLNGIADRDFEVCDRNSIASESSAENYWDDCIVGFMSNDDDDILNINPKTIIHPRKTSIKTAATEDITKDHDSFDSEYESEDEKTAIMSNLGAFSYPKPILEYSADSNDTTSSNSLGEFSKRAGSIMEQLHNFEVEDERDLPASDDKIQQQHQVPEITWVRNHGSNHSAASHISPASKSATKTTKGFDFETLYNDDTDDDVDYDVRTNSARTKSSSMTGYDNPSSLEKTKGKRRKGKKKLLQSSTDIIKSSAVGITSSANNVVRSSTKKMKSSAVGLKKKSNKVLKSSASNVPKSSTKAVKSSTKVIKSSTDIIVSSTGVVRSSAGNVASAAPSSEGTVITWMRNSNRSSSHSRINDDEMNSKKSIFRNITSTKASNDTARDSLSAVTRERSNTPKKGNGNIGYNMSSQGAVVPALTNQTPRNARYDDHIPDKVTSNRYLSRNDATYFPPNRAQDNLSSSKSDESEKKMTSLNKSAAPVVFNVSQLTASESSSSNQERLENNPAMSGDLDPNNEIRHSSVQRVSIQDDDSDYMIDNNMIGKDSSSLPSMYSFNTPSNTESVTSIQQPNRKNQNENSNHGSNDIDSDSTSQAIEDAKQNQSTLKPFFKVPNSKSSSISSAIDDLMSVYSPPASSKIKSTNKYKIMNDNISISSTIDDDGNSIASDNDFGSDTSSLVSRIVKVHKGKLGLTFKMTSEGPVIFGLSPDSTVKTLVAPGDLIIAINGIDTHTLTKTAISALLIRTAHLDRTFSVLSIDEDNMSFMLSDDYDISCNNGNSSRVIDLQTKESPIFFA